MKGCYYYDNILTLTAVVSTLNIGTALKKLGTLTSVTKPFIPLGNITPLENPFIKTMPFYCKCISDVPPFTKCQSKRHCLSLRHF